MTCLLGQFCLVWCVLPSPIMFPWWQSQWEISSHIWLCEHVHIYVIRGNFVGLLKSQITTIQHNTLNKYEIRKCLNRKSAQPDPIQLHWGKFRLSVAVEVNLGERFEEGGLVKIPGNQGRESHQRASLQTKACWSRWKISQRSELHQHSRKWP